MSLIDKLLSQVELGLWDYDAQTGKISNPSLEKFSIPHVIPTRLRNDINRDILAGSVQSYKEALAVHLHEQITDKKDRAVGKPRKEREAIEQELDTITEFLTTIDDHVRLKGQVYRSGNYKVYNLVTPSVEPDLQQLLLPSH
jgi:hypothetical protein